MHQTDTLDEFRYKTSSSQQRAYYDRSKPLPSSISKRTAAKVKGKTFGTGDFRESIVRDDIDAVVIVTPDHWHAIQCISACAAGKNVYVEKPLSETIHETGHVPIPIGSHGCVQDV